MKRKITDKRLSEVAAEYSEMAGRMSGELQDGPGAASAFYMSCSLGEVAEMARELLTLRSPVQVQESQTVSEGMWRTMDTAPLDGKHCILAVPELGGFIYSVQGAYQGGQWNAVHRENVKPLFWMPNIRLPKGWEAALEQSHVR